MAAQFQVDTGGSLTTGLEAYWKLDEASGTRVDFFGANDLTDNNTVGQATGIVNDAAQFVAANSEYLDIADNASLSMGDIDFTIACWVYLDSKPSIARIISKLDVGGDANNSEFGLFYLGGATDRFRFNVIKQAGTEALVTAGSFGSPSTGTWYFIVAWHDATANTISIQVNNGSVDTVSYSSGSSDSTAPFEIGRGISGAYWNGRIDEVGVWKKVLTAQERTDLYNGGSGNTLESVQTIAADTSIEGETSQTITADTEITVTTTSQTIDADTSIFGTTEQTLDADSEIIDNEITQTIDADTAIQNETSQTIDADTSVQVETSQTIDSDTMVFGSAEQTIEADTTLLVAEVELKLFKESDLSTEIGTEANPLDFGTAEAGETLNHPDNPFVLFNDKGAVIESVDAKSLTISVLELRIANELIANSNGAASQSYSVAYVPVETADTVAVKVDGTEWTGVSTFAGLSPTDEVYTFNAVTGTVTFGDGFQGKIPPNGDAITVTYTPDTLLKGKQVSEQLWVGVQSNGIIANDVSVELERVTPSDLSTVQTLRAPITSVSGVFLNTDPNRLGTNYFSGGGFDAQSGVITLGTALPSLIDVLIDYEYTIADDLEAGFTQIGRNTTHTFENPIPYNNAKRLNFRVVPPSDASASSPQTIRFRLRFTYTQ